MKKYYEVIPAALLVLGFAIVVAVEFFNPGPHPSALGSMTQTLIGTASLVLGSLFLLLMVLGPLVSILHYVLKIAPGLTEAQRARLGLWSKYSAIAMAAGLATLVFVWVQSGLGHKPYPGPFQALPETTADIPAAVQTLVADAFPVGTPEIDLIATVSQWGFVFHTTDGQLRADYTAGSLVCSNYLSIVWKSDEYERVTEVLGTSYLACL
jgi:hypothetical protein